MKMSSKGGTRLGVLAGAACVACCALPLMIGAGMLSGGAAALLADTMPLIAAALAVAAVAAFVLATRRKTRPAGCAGQCGSGAACKCASAPAPRL